MSNDGDGSDTAVGYGCPPAKSRFKKGQSGNPKGRPPKIERTLLPDQLTRDDLAIANRPVKIKVRGKVTEVSTREAVFLKLSSMALQGHGPSVREFLKRSDKATDEFFRCNEANMEMYIMVDNLLRSKLGRPSKAVVDCLNQLSLAIKKTL